MTKGNLRKKASLLFWPEGFTGLRVPDGRGENWQQAAGGATRTRDRELTFLTRISKHRERGNS